MEESPFRGRNFAEITEAPRASRRLTARKRLRYDSKITEKPHETTSSHGGRPSAARRGGVDATPDAVGNRRCGGARTGDSPDVSGTKAPRGDPYAPGASRSYAAADRAGERVLSTDGA